MGDGRSAAGRLPDLELEDIGLCAAHLFAAVFGCTVEDIRRPTRGAPRELLARQMAIYVAHTVLNLTPAETGIAFRRDRTTVWHTVQKVEGLRDDTVTDTLLNDIGDLMLRIYAHRATRILAEREQACGR